MKILFATDGSVNADIALQEILERDWPAGASCRVVTVAEALNKALDAALFGIGELAVRAQADLEADLHKLLIECEQKLTEKFGQGNVSTEFLEGNPKIEVTNAAKKWGSDLLIIGSHSHDVDDKWWGSVTRAIMQDAPCTVLVLDTPNGHSLEKKERNKEALLESSYLVAISDEHNAKMITDHIMALPWPGTSKFRVLCVVHKPAQGNQSRFFKSKNLEDLRQQAFVAQKQAAEKLVQSAKTKLESKFPAQNITAHVMEGNPHNAILQIAQDWPADMIIMGTHEKDHGMLEHFLGSTASAVVWNAECSVDLVKLARVPAIK